MEQFVATAIVSDATLRNWERLCRAPLSDSCLTQRANKKLSKKLVFPKEYITNLLNNRTVQNIIDTITEEEISTQSAVSSLCIALLCQFGLVQNRNGLFVAKNPHIGAFVNEICGAVNPLLLNVNLPIDENDIVGLIYQCLQSEGGKNIRGSYFTPKSIIKSLTADMDTTHATILDPCCGTGGFLMNIEGVSPENIYGVDIDAWVVMIAKTNLFIKYKEQTFNPNIYCGDFLSIGHTLFNTVKIPKQFDFILSNPPWGASTLDEYRHYYPKILSGESFSYFIAQSVSFLKHNGELHFLLPESVLNVKTHQDIRRLMLEQTAIRKISLFDRCFSGVYTPVVGIHIVNSHTKDGNVTIETRTERIECKQGEYLRNDHSVFTILSDIDRAIIDAIYQRPYQTLSGSKWALGIVTGDNKNRVLKSPQNGTEPIYTGKDVCRYRLKSPTSYIRYDRSDFQQVAPDDLYRAKEKLVYKFISNRLVFAYDGTGSLFLNSANILLPIVENMGIKTLLALLNSTVFQYLSMKKFGEIKVLRGNLEKLPLPKFKKSLDTRLTELVDSAILGDDSAHSKIQQLLYGVWGLTQTEIAHIEKVVYG